MLKRRYVRVALLSLILVGLMAPAASAAPGDLLATVDLEMPAGTAVAGTFDGTYYISAPALGTALYWMTPPAGTGLATLAFSKPVVDGSGNPIQMSAVAWDPGRGKLWAAAIGQAIWLIDISGANAVGTFQFNPGVGGSGLVDGLAYDASDDTLYFSPDVNLNVYHFSLGTGGNPALGTLMNTVTPKNAAGVADGAVSGVVVGSDNTLYIGRDGFAEIRRVDKTTGDFISQFATTAGRVEDLTCDPITYAPKEAILAKDAYNRLYEAFEVEPGTCPLPVVEVEVRVDIKPQSCPNPLNVNSKGVLPVAVLGTEDLDVTQLDVTTIQLEGVSPLRWEYEDVATPYDPYTRREGKDDCTEAGPDGFMDLTLKFDKQEIVAMLGDVDDGDVLVLHLTGNLLSSLGGTPIVGEDVVVILEKGK